MLLIWAYFTKKKEELGNYLENYNIYFLILFSYGLFFVNWVDSG